MIDTCFGRKFVIKFNLITFKSYLPFYNYNFGFRITVTNECAGGLAVI